MAQHSGAEQRERLERAIAHMESQRAALGDAVVDASVAALQKELRDLDAAGQAEQRKLVTVLFMDTVGSTEMTRELDPEENLALMDAAMQRLSPPVEQCGGRVVRYMGDGFKAVFGLPVAHENDARMAVRAGLGIIEAAQDYAREVAGYQVRVGIDTGWVAVGGLTEGEGTIMGMAVNLAARLESAAPAGGLLISQHTYQHVRGLFDLRPHEPVQAKGFPDPVPVYQVLRAKARSFRTRSRGVEGVETSMIGRDREMSLLQERFLDAAEESEGQFVTVVGEAGLGKSRLLYEFENWVDLHGPDVFLFRGRAQLQTQRLPYGLLRDLFAFRFNIQDDDSAQQVREKMAVGFKEVLGDRESEKKAQMVGYLLGYDFANSPHLEAISEEPQQIRDRSLSYMTDYFAAAAGHGPILVLLEDLHWADESSLDALALLGPALAEHRAMLLGAARHTLFERRPNWMEGQTFHLRLDLVPLSKRNSRRLVAEVLQRLDEVPDFLRDLVVGNAEGNPFYLEELIKMLLEEGAILKSEPKWQVRPEKLATAKVPSTLTGVLQARLEGLPHEERLLLQQASVVGRVFWDRALAYLNRSEEAKLGEAGVLDNLEGLRAKEMIFRRDLSAFAETNEHIFKHALLREVTYESVLKRVRRSYHALVADWLIAQSGERLGEVTGLIADHLQQAGKEPEALKYLLQAGDRARELYAHQEAIDSYRRALDYLGNSGDHVRAARVYMKLGLSYHAIFDFESAQEAYEAGFSEWQQAAEREAAESVSQVPAPHPIRAVSHRSPTRLDSTISNGTHSAWFINQLMSGLLQRTAEDELVPDIAQSWEVLDGGRTYVFHLRDDVKWSDGVPLTAADFEYAWKRLLHPDNDQGQGEMLFDISGARAYRERRLADPDQLGVHAMDSLTLVVKLEEPCAYFLHITAAPETMPLPRHVVERYGTSWTEPGKIVTNGPFKLESIKPEKSVNLERYKDYHGSFRGNASRVKIEIARGRAVLEMYERDELDFFTPFSHVSSTDGRGFIERHPGDYISVPEPVTRYVAFDVTKPPFDDSRVRQALVLATDRKLLANSMTRGSDSPAGGGLVPLRVTGHAPGIALPYDLALASEKLAEAGYPGGKGLPAVEGICPSTRVPLAMSEYLAAQWQRNLGLQVSFEALDADELGDRLAKNPPRLWVSGWRVDYPDPDSILRYDVLLHQTGWRNERYETLVEDARRTADQGQRMAMYRQAEQILVDEAPIVPMSYARIHMLVKPWLPGLPFSAIDDVILKDIVIEPH